MSDQQTAPDRVKRFAELGGIETQDLDGKPHWWSVDHFEREFTPLTDLNDAFAGLEGFCAVWGLEWGAQHDTSKYRTIIITGRGEKIVSCAAKVANSDITNAPAALCDAIVRAVLEAGASFP